MCRENNHASMCEGLADVTCWMHPWRRLPTFTGTSILHMYSDDISEAQLATAAFFELIIKSKARSFTCFEFKIDQSFSSNHIVSRKACSTHHYTNKHHKYYLIKPKNYTEIHFTIQVNTLSSQPTVHFANDRSQEDASVFIQASTLSCALGSPIHSSWSEWTMCWRAHLLGGRCIRCPTILQTASLY